MTEKVIIKFDGFCAPTNPGTLATYGFVIMSKDGEFLTNGNGLAVPYKDDDATSNVAEYKALIEGLKVAAERDWDVIEVRGDSQVIIRQLQGVYKVKAERLVKLYLEARGYLKNYFGVQLTWVERNLNRDADLEAYKAYLKWHGTHGKPEEREKREA